MSNDRANVAVLPPLPHALTLLAGIGLHLLWQPLALFPAAWVGDTAGWPILAVAALLAIWSWRTMARAGVSEDPLPDEQIDVCLLHQRRQSMSPDLRAGAIR